MREKPEPKPFNITVPNDVLEDLLQRLRQTRWPDEVPGAGWQFGTSLSYMRELVDYWQDTYDWRANERLLNSFSQYQLQMDDVKLHYICQPGVGPEPLPLILIHGWPSSICEFIKILGPLTDPGRHGGDPRDAFTVVAPSLPGYGYSHETGQRRLSIEEIADLFARLMTEVLGFRRFAAQGGDWGAFVAARLAYAYPDRMAGIHLNMVPLAPHPADRIDLTPGEEEFLKASGIFLAEETGYQWIQGTKPQTLAYGLNDSPVGLAAWIAEKFYAWTDCHEGLGNILSKDDLLTNIMLYWVTRTIHSSFWLYYQLRHYPWRLGRGERIRVPTAVAAFPREILRPPREWAMRLFNLQRWTPMRSGGHFAALEEPEAMVEDIRSFFRDWRCSCGLQHRG
jgi:pimeloyl-ACP methyl ester carboxylesterase